MKIEHLLLNFIFFCISQFHNSISMIFNLIKLILSLDIFNPSNNPGYFDKLKEEIDIHKHENNFFNF